MLLEERAANNNLRNEVNKLVESMSSLCIDHKAAIALCYGQYFQQKVIEFKKIEKLIRLLNQSVKSSSNDTTDINQLREYNLFFIGTNFQYIETNGFGLEQCRNFDNNESVVQTIKNACESSNTSDLQVVVKSETKSATWSGDHFCDFILKGDNCDNGIKMTGYGMTNSGNSPAVIVKSAPKIIIRKSVLASALVKATTSAKSSAKVPNTDHWSVIWSNDSSSVNGQGSSKVEASTSTFQIATTSSCMFKQSPKKIDKSNIVGIPDGHASVAVVDSLMVNESRSDGGAVPVAIATENYENIPLENFKFPARLRMKRNLEVMTRTDNLPNNVANHVEDPDTDPTDTKRPRE